MLEKGLIVNSLLGEYQLTLSIQKGREGDLAGFLVHVSKSNLNNLERALKKFKALIGF